MPETASHEYRGYTIITTDTGGRRAGREIVYNLYKGKTFIHGYGSYEQAKRAADRLLDETEEDRKNREDLIKQLDDDSTSGHWYFK